MAFEQSCKVLRDAEIKFMKDLKKLREHAVIQNIFVMIICCITYLYIEEEAMTNSAILILKTIAFCC